MDENLPRLASELRKETCPQRVLDEVARRISAQAAAPPRRFHYGIPVMLAGLVLFCGLALWRWPADRKIERTSSSTGQAALDHAQIAAQAEGALGFIGSILLDAGTRSRRVIFDRAVPPLRNGLETAKEKVIHRIAL